MAFEKLKDQLRENWADLSSKIQENPQFNTLRENFESQTPTVQKAIIGGLCALVAIFFLSFPWGYLSEASDHMTEFDDNRSLIEGLLHASHAAKEPAPLPAPISFDALKGRVDQVLKSNRLIPEQVVGMQMIPGQPAGKLAPAVVMQNGLVVQLKKLNVEQLISLGAQLQNLGQGIKLMGVDILQSPGQDHYYDMNARVVAFALPPINVETDEDAGGKSKKKKSPAAKKAVKPSNEEGE